MKNAKAYTVKHWAPLCELLKKKIMNLEKKKNNNKTKKPLERSQDKNLELLSIIRCCILWSK